MDKTAIENHYLTVKKSIDNALKATQNIQVKGDDENAFVKEIQNGISKINTDFKNEIDELQNGSEWDRFCISFFGETNAGKSTLIDTLRIIYNEDSRLKEVIDNREEVLKLLNQRQKASEIVKENIDALYNEVLIINKEFEKFKQDKETFKKDKSSLEREKADSLAQINNERKKIYLYIIFFIVGFLAGAALIILLTKILGVF